MKQNEFPIVVLLSGNGSNFQAIIDSIANKMWDITICAAISDNEQAYGLERARQAGIPAIYINPKQYQQRRDYELALQEQIDQFAPKLVILAGFMRLLSAEFVDHYQPFLLNIHPSLLPKFKGLHTHQRALEAGEKMHGCTVHIVSAKMDEGPILAQMECEISTDDTAESLQQKVHRLEHILYPEIINQIAIGQIKLRG
jgi:phosphoribosylglycinamide formyltransferase-1